MAVENLFWKVLNTEGETVKDGFFELIEAYDFRREHCPEGCKIESYQTGPIEIPYGIFGTGRIIREQDGFIELNVLVEESGLFAGVPPEELRIREVLPPDMDDQEIQSLLEGINKKRDLPLYVRKARIQIIR